jgi:hypothetical protein
MDGGDDSFSLSRQILKQLHNLKSLEAIKSRCWLIKKNETWIGNKLYTNGCSLSLSSRDSFL